MEDETGVKLVCAKPGSCHSKPETERQLTPIQVILNPCLLRSLKVGFIPTYTVGNNPQYCRSYPHHLGCSTKGLAVGTSLAIDTAYTHTCIVNPSSLNYDNDDWDRKLLSASGLIYMISRLI